MASPDMPDAGPNEVLYVLNFRYSGGGGGARSYYTLGRKLYRRGWRKVQNMTCLYVLIKRHDEEIDEDVVRTILLEQKKEGDEVFYGISKYRPPNERGDPVEGIRHLFEYLED